MLWTPSAPSMSYGQTELIHTIRRCGLTSGLKLCLDAGDANSYSGSGQSWLDTSGNGYDFFRGATSGAEASDPTFNGTAGQRSSGEYWSFDGGDFFRYDSANETWMNNLHKDNAKFTLLAWVYVPNTAGNQGISGTNNAGSVEGYQWYFDSTEAVHFDVLKTSALVLSATVLASQPTATWLCLAISIDEAVGANGGNNFVNGVSSLFTSTYTSPGVANAAYTMEIAAFGNGGQPPGNTARLGMFAAWEGVALTQSQLTALYMATRGRFGV